MSNKQTTGGKLEIPDGWFVCGVDFDADPPWCRITNPDIFATGDQKVLPIPPSLADYLSRHFCGSRVMQQRIADNTRREISNKIKEALGLD